MSSLKQSTQQLLIAAKELGFELSGIVIAQPPKYFDAFERWLRCGMHAGMNHFVRNFEVRRHPSILLPCVQSILMLGVSYSKVLTSETLPIRQLKGIVEYARGTDYHRWIRVRLAQLSVLHRRLFPEGRCRGTVDTAPIFEKYYASAAGLGTVGKNTLLINPELGSKIFLAAFLSTERLEPAQLPMQFKPCTNCRRCLDACPAGAFAEPFVLDCRRCLSYWTLIHRKDMPKEISLHRGNRFLGCDVCQQVCPHNQTQPIISEGTIDPFSLTAQELQPFLENTALVGSLLTVSSP